MSAADHPLAQAAARAGFATDVVVSCDALGRSVDAAIAGLGALVPGDPGNADAIRAVEHEFLRIAGTVSGGEFPAYWNWYRGGIAALIAAVRRVGLDPADFELRAPAWR